MVRAKQVGDVVDRSSRDQRVEHERSDLVVLRSTRFGHGTKAMHLALAQGTPWGRAHIPGNRRSWSLWLPSRSDNLMS